MPEIVRAEWFLAPIGVTQGGLAPNTTTMSILALVHFSSQNVDKRDQRCHTSPRSYIPKEYSLMATFDDLSTSISTMQTRIDQLRRRL